MRLKEFLDTLIYETFRVVYTAIFRLYFRGRVYGTNNIPSTGGAILAVNHTSALDPALAGIHVKRKIWYVGRADLAESRFARVFLGLQHLIPITRGSPDIKATKRIISLIRSGEIVLMFPEGTRSINGTLGKGREGIGMFVSRAKADVIPCYISGAWRALPKGALIFRPRRIRVAFGPLIRFDEFRDCARGRAGYKEISATIMERLAELKRQLEGRK